jgi:hypothetical protein
MNLVRYTLLEVVLGGSILSVAWAQAPEARPEPPRAAPAPDHAPTAVRPPDDHPRSAMPRAVRRRGFSPPALGGHGGPGGMSGRDVFDPGPFGHGRAMAFPHRMSEEEMQEMEAMDQALSKLKAGKNDAEKESAKKDLSQALDKLFQRDLEQREHQVTEIEARVKKLRDQIEKRKAAKAEILSLHLKTIINESEGLGFPGHFDHDGDSHARDFQWLAPRGNDGSLGFFTAPPAGLPTPEPPEAQ